MVDVLSPKEKIKIFMYSLKGVIMKKSVFIHFASVLIVLVLTACGRTNTATRNSVDSTSTPVVVATSTPKPFIATPLPLVKPPFNEPVQEKPANGYSKNFTNLKRQAPLTIKTPSEGDYCYYILLKSESTNKSVISLFVYPGKTAEIKVPLGRYTLYYATGTEWYGTKHLFGPDTVYSKADEVLEFKVQGNKILGHTIELIKQVGGNLSTSKADQSQFEE